MKNNNGLFKLFVYELRNMFSSELQIIEHLPHLIKLAKSEELKEALLKHLNETKQQFIRLEHIFLELNLKNQKHDCLGMKGILKEASEIIKKIPNYHDVAIIEACQKVEHYEICSYGTLCAFAKELEFDKKILKLLEKTLEEEHQADNTLNKIACGTIFHEGLNHKMIEGQKKKSEKVA